MNKEYKICIRCIMDTTEKDITFDESGICNHCRNAEKMLLNFPMDDLRGSSQLNKIVDEIKKKGINKRYDCIIGVSGGVDSTFVAYKVKQLGLKPLAVHLDNGWDSELAVNNIKKTLDILGIDLYTFVLDWEQFKDLQISFLKAAVPDGEIPTDHAIGALLYKMAVKMGIKYIISGTNLSTESIMPKTWAYGHGDWKYIKSIHKMFGKMSLKSYPHYTLYDMFYYKMIRGIKNIRLLNLITYRKEDAMEILRNDLRWEYYGGKHYESIYTRFYQSYILPHKFGIDKRRAHLSSLIISGQISRETALQEMSKEIYSKEKIDEDRDYVIKKLDLSEDEFEGLMELPNKNYSDYPIINSSLFDFLQTLYLHIKGK